jgi:hypothetical protein
MIFFLAVIVLSTANISHAEPASSFNVQVLLPGMTKIIELEQQQTLPLGCPQFFIFTVGRGFLGLSLKKDDLSGDTLFMTGFVSAGGEIAAIRRIGISKGMIDQVIEIGGDTNSIGFAWLWCGIAVSQNVPLYTSELRLSLQP